MNTPEYGLYYVNGKLELLDTSKLDDLLKRGVTDIVEYEPPKSPSLDQALEIITRVNKNH